MARGRRSRGSRSASPRRGRRSSSSGRARPRPKVDVNALTDEVLREVYPRLGLEGIIGPERLRPVVADIVTSIVEARSTKPSVESIVKRITAMPGPVYKAVAAMLAEEPERLNREQLEFIVANAPEVAGRGAPLLYRRAVELGAWDVVDALRSLWVRYGRPTPIRCPRCGFDAVTPTLECMVCGASLSEEEVKESIGFRDMLRRFAETEDPALVREAAEAGFVLVDHEVHPPSRRPLLGFYVELYLTRGERAILRAALQARGR